MIHIYSSRDEEAQAYRIRAVMDLRPAIAARLRDGVPVIEFAPDGVYQYQLDDFGGVRRVNLGVSYYLANC